MELLMQIQYCKYKVDSVSCVSLFLLLNIWLILYTLYHKVTVFTRALRLYLYCQWVHKYPRCPRWTRNLCQSSSNIICEPTRARLRALIVFGKILKFTKKFTKSQGKNLWKIYVKFMLRICKLDCKLYCYINQRNRWNYCCE